MAKHTIQYVLLPMLLFPVSSMAIDDAWQRSHTLEASGQYTEAATTIEKFLKQIPDNEYAELRSGWLYYMAGNFSRSIKHYQTALNLNEKSIEARLGLTLPLMAQGRWQEAMAQSNEVITVSRWNYYAHIRLMACEEALKQWDTMLKHVEEVRLYYPTDPTVLVYLARVQAQLGKMAKARQAYSEVLKRVPGHVEASAFLSK